MEKNKELKFESISQYIEMIGYFPNQCYRGQTNKDKTLIPKAGRKPFYNPQKSDDSHLRFILWKNKIVAHLTNYPKEELALLALAQHYGLATKLLDWTTNPLVALFFAVEDEFDIDGAVFVYYISKCIKSDTPIDKLEEVCVYFPQPFDRRILVQKGLFTFHPNPSLPLENKCKTEPLIRLVVSSKNKKHIKRELSNYGIDYEFLFPGLDGLAKQINYHTVPYLGYYVDNVIEEEKT